VTLTGYVYDLDYGHCKKSNGRLATFLASSSLTFGPVGLIKINCTEPVINIMASEDELLRECPICMDDMEAKKILQCVAGHSLCQRCYQTQLGAAVAARQCPTCRGGFHNPPGRNYLAENLLKKRKAKSDDDEQTLKEARGHAQASAGAQGAGPSRLLLHPPLLLGQGAGPSVAPAVPRRPGGLREARAAARAAAATAAVGGAGPALAAPASIAPAGGPAPVVDLSDDED
jgi:hypothetical protein